jgi:prepilin-type N-terminal cleavage/methylation domain-containing protein
MNTKNQGFTLIELMVVVTIIALLAVAILPELIKSTERANQAVDQANLRWHFTAFTNYKGRYKTPPRGGGHKFVIDPWVRGVVEHTPQNMDRYFSPQAIGDGDGRHEELKAMDAEEYWKTQEELTTEDTNWAGLAVENKRGMWSGKVIWMATDNENGNVYKDGSVVVLFGDGSAKTLFRDPDFIKLGYSPDMDEDDLIEVGPNSRHKLLQKLEH